jgi:UDP-N-acetyl-2-amino-2-deoxyglucuronate dehydrogenase
MPEVAPVRFGIIGCGGAAVPVAEAMAASSVTALASVYDVKPALSQDLGNRFGAAVHDSLETLLADAGVDAVYIAVPHNQLAPLATRALEAGKHVFVEKPMATTLAEADSLVALAETHGRVLGVNYELRHSAANIRGRNLLQAGAIGKVIGVHSQTLIDKPQSYWQAGYANRGRSPWRGSKVEAGGGVVLMNTSHALDTIRWLTGLEVVRVAGEIGTLVAEGVEVEDTASASLRFSNGAIGSLFVGAHMPGVSREEQISIYGAEGQLRLPYPYGGDPLRAYFRREWEGLAPNQWHTLAEPQANLFTGAVDAFARIVQRDLPMPAGQAPGSSAIGLDARQVLAIVLGLYQSSAEHSVVSL